jgi:tyrosyl-tRNA synthetase
MAETAPEAARIAAHLARNAVDCLPSGALEKRLAEGRPLRAKLGLDPTAADVHLGHTVVLQKLREFQDLGHTVVLIIGDYTARVGDPSGRSATRPVLSGEEIDANARTYVDQAAHVLRTDERLEIRHNSEWLDMSMESLFGLVRHATVAQLLERDDFARRFAERSPISLSEFFYPVLQGIDSVQIRADIELGGTDQTFNNLIGRELQRSKGQPPQAVLTVPLLVGTDGVEKMGKSLGNWIAISEPAAEQFGKVMSIPDAAVSGYASLCTTLHPRVIEQLTADVRRGGSAANQAKRRVAREIVTLYHGPAAARVAEDRFDALFKRHEVPTEVADFSTALVDPVHLPALLVAAGLAESASAARRHIDAGAVRIDGQVQPRGSYDVAPDTLRDSILAVGKRKAVRVSPQPVTPPPR